MSTRALINFKMSVSQCSFEPGTHLRLILKSAGDQNVLF